MEYILSQNTKYEINELLTNHSCYYPFEWINAYNHLLNMQEQVPISTETMNEYCAIFNFVKEQCEKLILKHPNHKNTDNWQKGIAELNNMLLTHFDKWDEKSDYFEEVAIAEKTIIEHKLSNIVRDSRLICDVYCVPSNNHQAFFVQVFENEKEYIMVYAKTYVVDRRGNRIAMYGFKDCVASQKHSSTAGKIICGIKKLEKQNNIICKLISCLPKRTEWLKRIFMIDGEYMVIRSYTSSNVKILSYNSNSVFEKNNYSDEQKEFLGKLFLHIESIIGNVLEFGRSLY